MLAPRRLAAARGAPGGHPGYYGRGMRPSNPRTPPAASSSGATQSLSSHPLPPAPVVMPPGEEAIRRRAYQRYLERGCTPGDPVEDWLQAEWELKLGLRPS